MTRGKDPKYMYSLNISIVSLLGVTFIITLHMTLTSDHIALVLIAVFHTGHHTHFIHLCNIM